jgi:hypothetical protein
MANPNQTISPINPDFPVGPAQNSPESAGPPISEIATDISFGGLKPGTTSRDGGSLPFHTTGIWNKVPLIQDQPKPFFYRQT